ncbi:MAG: benzoate transporter [Sphingomonadales bacterium]
MAGDPRRSAILLVGGDKSGDGRFYERLIPVADRLYDVYLDELRKEGLLP